MPTSPNAPAGGPVALRSIALLSAAAFCSAATLRVADPLLPQIAHEFAVTTGGASIITTAFTLSYGLFQILYGPLGDRFGKYWVIAVTMTIATVAVLATPLAVSLTALAWFRFAAGATAAAVIPLSIAFIGDMVAYDRRQPVLAKFLSGQILGLVFGQVAGGIMLEIADWRSAFLLLGVAFAAVTAAIWWELRSGRIVEATTTGSLRPGRLLRQSTALLAAKRPRLVLSAVFAEGFMFFGAFAYFGAYLRHEFALDYIAIGLLLAGFGLGGLSYSIASRQVVTRLGERRMVQVGGALLAVSFAGFCTVPYAPAVLPAIVAIGFGFYMFHNTLQTNATQMAPEARGTAVSLFALCFFLGQAFGVAFAGAMLDRFGYPPVFITAGIGLLAIGFVYSARRTAG